jgi:peptidylprolyl isomerase
MIVKLASTALLVALTAAATAQTTPKTTATTTTHHAATTRSTTPPNIPRVVGIPRTLYALKYVDIKVGTGPLAESSVLGTSQANSKIMFYTVRYTGWLTNGTKFDSSYDHPGGEDFTFPEGVHRVIAGWDTGFQGMRLGGKRRLFIPYQLAYGESGKGPIPPKSDLIFDIELVAASTTPPAPKQTTPPPAVLKQTPPPPAPSAAPAKPADTPPAPAAQPSTGTPPPADATTPAAQPKTPPHPEGL